MIKIKKGLRVYSSKKIVLTEQEKEELEQRIQEDIIEKRLFPYIPFYIARYEKEIASEGDIENVIEELTYFRNEMVRLHQGNYYTHY